MTENQRSRKKLTKESLPSTRNCVAANFTRVTSIPTGLTIEPTSPLARLTPFSTLARRYTITNLGNLRFWTISSDFELYLSFFFTNTVTGSCIAIDEISLFLFLRECCSYRWRFPAWENRRDFLWIIRRIRERDVILGDFWPKSLAYLIFRFDNWKPSLYTSNAIEITVVRINYLIRKKINK